MSRNWIKVFIISLCIVGVMGVSLLSTSQAANSPTTIVIVGDSTASDYDSSRAPRTGWGQTFNQFFTEQVVVKNHAASGRSSKSFISEGRMTRALADLKEGDYLMIQFGHNDSKKDDPTRYTEPFTTYKEHLTLYIEGAREKGATPILLSPIERRGFNSNGTVKASHGKYPEAMKELATELDVLFIDITAKSQALFRELGPDATKNIFLWLNSGEHPNYPTGVQDNTHLQTEGALAINQLVIDGLRELNHSLTNYLK